MAVPNHNKSIFLAGLLLAAAQPALATAGESWAGCYGGVHAGYGWAGIAGHDPLFNVSIGSATAKGGAIGAQLGCDRQDGKVVMGAQLSLAKSDLSGDHRYIAGSGPFDRVTYDVEYLATLSARLGYTLQPATLAYLKAGGAWTRTNHDDSDPAPIFGIPYTGNERLTRWGWLIGLGLEHKVGKNLSAYAEYAHMGFGKKTTTIFYSDGVVAPYSFKQDMDYVMVGLNYQF